MLVPGKASIAGLTSFQALSAVFTPSLEFQCPQGPLGDLLYALNLSLTSITSQESASRGPPVLILAWDTRSTCLRL